MKAGVLATVAWSAAAPASLPAITINGSTETAGQELPATFSPTQTVSTADGLLRFRPLIFFPYFLHMYGYILYGYGRLVNEHLKKVCLCWGCFYR